MAREQARRRDDHARRADPALRAAVLDEGLLHAHAVSRPHRRTPSIVVIAAPSACSTGVRQLFTSSPFTSTEHAPHSPSPQPSLVPVRPQLHPQHIEQPRHRMGVHVHDSSAVDRSTPDRATGGASRHGADSRLDAARSIVSISDFGRDRDLSRPRAPVAWAIALAIAGATPSIGSSPMPLAPNGPCA